MIASPRDDQDNLPIPQPRPVTPRCPKPDPHHTFTFLPASHRSHHHPILSHSAHHLILEKNQKSEQTGNKNTTLTTPKEPAGLCASVRVGMQDQTGIATLTRNPRAAWGPCAAAKAAVWPVAQKGTRWLDACRRRVLPLSQRVLATTWLSISIFRLFIPLFFPFHGVALRFWWGCCFLPHLCVRCVGSEAKPPRKLLALGDLPRSPFIRLALLRLDCVQHNTINPDGILLRDGSPFRCSVGWRAGLRNTTRDA
jgi:hypothetical protein